MSRPLSLNHEAHGMMKGVSIPRHDFSFQKAHVSPVKSGQQASFVSVDRAPALSGSVYSHAM